MSEPRTILPSQDELALTAAIDRRCRASVTIECPDGWRSCKADFSAGSAESRAVVIDLHTTPDGPWTPGALCRRNIGVTFRLGRRKCMFATRVRSATPSGNAVSLRADWPVEISFLQRRAYDRMEPPAGHVVTVRFWRFQSSRDKGCRENIQYGQLENISAGGMRVKTRALTDIELEQTYRCSFTPLDNNAAIVLDACLRHRESVDGNRASLGFQFIGLEATAQGRKTLTQLAAIVARYQRNRRKKHPGKPQ